MTECISFVKNEPRINIGNDNRSFTFDFVYPPMSTQKEIYNSSIIPLIDRFIEGQTGSGKTYSMGTGLEAICSNPDKQGIIPRFTETIFNRMTQIKDESPSNDFQIYVSYIELYNEDINDLLLTSESNISGQDNNPPTIREDTEGNIVWSGINEKRVYTKNDILRLLQKGSQRRTTGSTKMNMSSSRSHAIFSILLKQQIMENNDIQTNNHLLNDENSIIPERLVSFNSKHLVSKFHFVDLAGSERLKRTNAIGDRQKEGIFINGGLLALGNVISALSDESNSKRGSQHVPYRDSKLTRLLQDSLGGNSHTLMLACISSSSSDYMETLNTLKYASRACHIHNKVRINLDHQGIPLSAKSSVSA
ncbi:P-loop containing nucleoside triphosphate hydrolase protein [Cokeromyces recurvatus]|uniref:P-loop containing nucleoside triphosphate hydrolase protein n=1 Tax=Cokeromyces recurvatus TaxID=90255 RepID=UPI002220E240|nr:P-loop containing nucleoside triphosphate hydrolase protein [Cokeromyces recurvatus]KAI7903258.1 P-loop containing nucleoside triphosphate hydrolase protein [Cokeromyces recurvatus]